MKLWKNYNKIITLIVLIGILAGGSAAFATDEERIAELQKQIEALQAQADQYKDSIAGEQAKGATLKNEIASLKAQIGGLETQISLNSKKITKTKVEIDGVQSNIFDTQQKISKQKGAISRLILFVNRQDNESLLATLLKNQNISDFFNQAQYASDINKQLLAAVGDLQGLNNDLEDSKNELQGKQTELERLNAEADAKKSSLSSAKSSKDNLLQVTKGQEASYQKLLTEVQRKEAEFFTELQVLEKNVVAGGLYIVHVTATSVPPKGTKIFRWPLDGRYISQGYGYTAYAKRGAYGGAPHNGVDIATGFGQPIYAIGDGVVIANGLNNPGWGNWVAIKHTNNMVSVYGHMSSPTALGVVSTQVKAGDIIGYEGATGNVTGPHLHLSLYKDFFTYDKGGELEFNYWDGTVNPLDYVQ